MRLTKFSCHIQRSSDEVSCTNVHVQFMEEVQVLHKMLESETAIKHCHNSNVLELKLFITLEKIFICFSSVSHFTAGKNVLCNTSLDNYLITI